MNKAWSTLLFLCTGHLQNTSSPTPLSLAAMLQGTQGSMRGSPPEAWSSSLPPDQDTGLSLSCPACLAPNFPPLGAALGAGDSSSPIPQSLGLTPCAPWQPKAAPQYPLSAWAWLHGVGEPGAPPGCRGPEKDSNSSGVSCSCQAQFATNLDTHIDTCLGAF